MTIGRIQGIYVIADGTERPQPCNRKVAETERNTDMTNAMETRDARLEGGCCLPLSLQTEDASGTAPARKTIAIALAELIMRTS